MYGALVRLSMGMFMDVVFLLKLVIRIPKNSTETH